MRNSKIPINYSEMRHRCPRLYFFSNGGVLLSDICHIGTLTLQVGSSWQGFSPFLLTHVANFVYSESCRKFLDLPTVLCYDRQNRV